jgi:tRNA (guanine-N7-)-methyltransferase
LRRSRSISVAATVRFLPFWHRKIRRTIFSGSNGCWEECGVFAARVARLDLKNARILRMESNYAVTHLLPPASVTSFHLLFPDPWPKRRHHRRRAFTPEFVSSIHRALIAGGLFHVATDHADYFHQIERVIAATDIFVISREQYHFPPTSFEQKYVARGLSIHRLLLRKVSPVR